MSIGKDKESPRPPSQKASPDTAVLDFLSVIAKNSLTEERSTGQWLTDLSGGTSRVNLDSFKKNVPQDANRNEGSVWLPHTSPCLASCFSPKGHCTGGFQPFAHQAVIYYPSGRGKLWKGLRRSDPCLPPPHVPPCASPALPHCRTFCSTSPWHRKLHLCLSLLSLLNQTGIFWASYHLCGGRCLTKRCFSTSGFGTGSARLHRPQKILLLLQLSHWHLPLKQALGSLCAKRYQGTKTGHLLGWELGWHCRQTGSRQDRTQPSPWAEVQVTEMQLSSTGQANEAGRGRQHWHHVPSQILA